jgi:hypothetical protein
VSFIEVSSDVARILAALGIEVRTPSRRGVTPVFMVPGWTVKVADWVRSNGMQSHPEVVMPVYPAAEKLAPEQVLVIRALKDDLKERWPVLSAAFMLGGPAAAWALVYDWVPEAKVPQPVPKKRPLREQE